MYFPYIIAISSPLYSFVLELWMLYESLLLMKKAGKFSLDVGSSRFLTMTVLKEKSQFNTSEFHKWNDEKLKKIKSNKRITRI